MQFEEELEKNPKISSSVCFYKISDKSITDPATKTNYIVKEIRPKQIDSILPIEEYPGTWKKAPPKINSNKLPSAFGGIFQKTGGKNRKYHVFEEEKQNKIINPIKNIENIVNFQEYKQAMQLLSPLKLDSRRSKNRQPKKRKNKKNPLEPLRSYMMNFTKLSEELKELSDISDLQIDQLITNQLIKNPLINLKIRLEELITLSSLKMTSQGLFKKMLHVPSFELYGLKEVPIINKDCRKRLKDWISLWQNKFNTSENHIKILATFWNAPEGYLSVITEYMEGGSLQGLLDSVGGLPEHIIKKIAREILRGIEKMKGFYHGKLIPSQILFNKEGNIKLSFGISRKATITNDNSKTDENSFIINSELFCLSKIKTPLKICNSLDIFNLGIICLTSILGSIEILDFTDINLSKLVNLMNSEQSESLCCLIHSEDYLLNFLKEPSEKKKTLRIIDILKKYSISNDLINFLCNCLQLNSNKRSTIQNLMNTSFIQNELEETKVSIKELIRLNRGLEPQILSISEKQLEKICDAITIVLPVCNKIPDLQNLMGKNKVIENISFDLGLSYEKILKVFSECIMNFEKK